jgi:hypothetical protein
MIWQQHADAPHALWLLRPRHQRPPRATEHRDELAPLHSITGNLLVFLDGLDKMS